jgi:uncharacterized protein involved in exopolysaccharide biosynthesis
MEPGLQTSSQHLNSGGTYTPPTETAMPRVGAWEAVRRHSLAIVLITLTGAALGVVAGLVRAPTYTAESRLAVGRLDVSAPGAVSTFAVAAQALATQYSRAVDARAVVEPVSRQLGTTPLEAARRLSATPIPESPVFRIEATGDSERAAVALAGAASTQLVEYTTKLNRSNPDSARLLRRFQRAAVVLNRKQAARDRLRRTVGRSPSGRGREALIAAATETQLAQLEFQTLRANYQTSQQSQAATALVQVLTTPSKAASDRWPRLQLFLFIGLAIGLTFGLAFAMLRTSREARRAIAP